METLKQTLLDLWPTLAFVGGALVCIFCLFVWRLVSDGQAEAAGREGETRTSDPDNERHDCN